jgi:hypothetical protein
LRIGGRAEKTPNLIAIADSTDSSTPPSNRAFIGLIFKLTQLIHHFLRIGGCAEKILIQSQLPIVPIRRHHRTSLSSVSFASYTSPAHPPDLSTPFSVRSTKRADFPLHFIDDIASTHKLVLPLSCQSNFSSVRGLFLWQFVPEQLPTPQVFRKKHEFIREN